jgi:hypothetical protein
MMAASTESGIGDCTRRIVALEKRKSATLVTGFVSARRDVCPP